MKYDSRELAFDEYQSVLLRKKEDTVKKVECLYAAPSCLQIMAYEDEVRVNITCPCRLHRHPGMKNVENIESICSSKVALADQIYAPVK